MKLLDSIKKLNPKIVVYFLAVEIVQLFLMPYAGLKFDGDGESFYLYEYMLGVGSKFEEFAIVFLPFLVLAATIVAAVFIARKPLYALISSVVGVLANIIAVLTVKATYISQVCSIARKELRADDYKSSDIADIIEDRAEYLSEELSAYACIGFILMLLAGLAMVYFCYVAFKNSGGELKIPSLGSVKTCPVCNASVPAKNTFCTKCGTSLASVAAKPVIPTCPKCGKIVSPNTKFCQKCGTPMAPTNPPSGINK